MKITKIINLWLPVFAWAGVIFLFSSLPTIKTTDFYLWDFLLKKTAHIVEYGIFATLVYRALINSGISMRRATWVAVLSALLYGASDEFHQSFTPGRGPTVRDVLIDTTGAIIFIFGIIKNTKKLPNILQKLFLKLNLIKI